MLLRTALAQRTDSIGKLSALKVRIVMDAWLLALWLGLTTCVLCPSPLQIIEEWCKVDVSELNDSAAVTLRPNNARVRVLRFQSLSIYSDRF